MKKVNHVGLENIATNGQKMVIIAYRKANDIDVQFEDGTIVYHKDMAAFRRGQIKNPNKISIVKRDEHLKHLRDITTEEKKKYYEGMEVQQKDGIAVCVEYRTAKDIDVKFIDSDEIINTTTSNFTFGKIRKSDKKMLFGDDYMQSLIGRKFVNQSGHNYEIIGGKDCKHVIVRFDDGKTVKNLLSHKVLKGEVVYPGERMYVRMTTIAKKKIGERYRSTIDMGFEITDFRIEGNKTIYTIRFDDGTECENAEFGTFKRGEVKHPKIKAKYKAVNIDFNGFKVYDRMFSAGKGDHKYYSCMCKECGLEDIKTFDEMLMHKCHEVI